MKYTIKQLTPHKKTPLVLCLGFFDGLHLGHFKVFNRARQFAKENNLTVAMMTFDVSPKSDPRLLTPQKEDILKEWQVDQLITLTFDDELKNMTPNQFIENLEKELNVTALFFGENFRFGKNRQGDSASILRHHEIKVEVVEDELLDNTPISTTLIKETLSQQNIKKANQMLNRPFSISGIVVKGKQNGRKIGFKTANVELLKNQFLPPKGVYQVEVELDNKKYQGIANIGTHPSIDELDQPILEVHLLNFDQEIYGMKIKCHFCDFIRQELKFTNLEELKKQITYDINALTQSLDKA